MALLLIGKILAGTISPPKAGFLHVQPILRSFSASRGPAQSLLLRTLFTSKEAIQGLFSCSRPAKARRKAFGLTNFGSLLI